MEFLLDKKNSFLLKILTHFFLEFIMAVAFFTGKGASFY
jgi:hypothetical protein